MARRDREELKNHVRVLDKYQEDSPDRLTPVNVNATEGSNVTINFGNALPETKKNSLISALSGGFKQLPRTQKTLAYFLTLVFIAYLIASGTKLVGVW